MKHLLGSILKSGRTGIAKSQKKPVFNRRYVFCLRRAAYYGFVKSPFKAISQVLDAIRVKILGRERHTLYRSALFILARR